MKTGDSGGLNAYGLKPEIDKKVLKSLNHRFSFCFPSVCRFKLFILCFGQNKNSREEDVMDLFVTLFIYLSIFVSQPIECIQIEKREVGGRGQRHNKHNKAPLE